RQESEEDEVVTVEQRRSEIRASEILQRDRRRRNELEEDRHVVEDDLAARVPADGQRPHGSLARRGAVLRQLVEPLDVVLEGDLPLHRVGEVEEVLVALRDEQRELLGNRLRR